MGNAVASEFNCNVCMVSLADPDLKDDSLRHAMQRVPKKSVVVFEDVDSLFNHFREKDCGARGSLLFLTTNHRERLDKALIRPGRCDVQVELDYASSEQIGRMFARFFEGATDEQKAAFVAAVRKAEGGR